MSPGGVDVSKMTTEEWVRIIADPNATERQRREAFRQIYDAFAPRVRAVIFRIAGEVDLSDLVQDCFVKIWTMAPHFRGECTLSTWIYQIALNVARDCLRSRKRKRWLMFTNDE